MNRLTQSALLVVLATLYLSKIQGCEAKSIVPNNGALPSVAFQPKRHAALMTKKVTTRVTTTTSTNRINKESLNESVSKISQGGATSKSTLSVAIFNLVKGIVGAGVLSLPAGVAAFGDAKSAVVPAVALITIVGILSGYNFSLIGRICAYTGASSYSDAWSKSVGPSTSTIPAAACTCKTFLAVLAYSMVLTETFQGIGSTVGMEFSRSQVAITLTSIVLLPLCLMKNLASLAPFSLMGIIGMALTVICMAVRYFDGSYSLPDGKFLADLGDKLPIFGSNGAKSALSPNSFILICMLSTAYMAHFNAPKFYDELENNTIANFNVLVSTSFAIAILIFSAATALGFATFGKACSGFILSNYSAKDSLIGISRLLVAFSLICTYPLVFVGCRDGFLDLVRVPKEKRTNTILNQVTVCLLALITAAAIVMKDLSFVLAFGGATLGNALIYLFPAIMFRSMVKNLGDDAPESMKKEVYISYWSGLLGVVMGFIGANMALKSL